MPLNDGAINEILPFAPDGLESSGDLIALGEYATDDMRKRGHQPGLARRSLQNRAQRQAAHVVAGVAQFVANRHVAGVRDDGDLDAVEEGLKGAVREEAEVVRDDSCRGFTSEGQHVAYEADLAAIDRNSLYAVQQGVATGLPEDMPADAWAFVHTMVLPGDAARTQLLWSVDDPDHPGWWRRRAAGAWGEWKGVGSGGGGVPVGMIDWFPGTTPPDGWLAINDSPLLSRTAYPQLWAVAQASGNIITDAAWLAQAAVQSSVGAFSSGDGATTFRCPRLRDHVVGPDTAAGRVIGAFERDAIVNITASVSDYLRLSVAGGTVSGAFTTDGAGRQVAGNTTGNAQCVTGFDASKVVNTADQVRPRRVTLMPCIKAFDAAVNEGLVDVAALAVSLAGKVDRSDWTGSFGSTGWRKHPDGTIEQWGTVTTASGTANVTFPIAFPNAVYTVLLTDSVAATPQAAYIFALGGAPSLTGFTVKAQTDAGASAADTAFWRAWGK